MIYYDNQSSLFKYNSFITSNSHGTEKCELRKLYNNCLKEKVKVKYYELAVFLTLDFAEERDCFYGFKSGIHSIFYKKPVYKKLELRWAEN